MGNADELNNSGVIARRDLTRIHSNQLENQGTILGETVDLSAQQNLIIAVTETANAAERNRGLTRRILTFGTVKHNKRRRVRPSKKYGHK